MLVFLPRYVCVFKARYVFRFLALIRLRFLGKLRETATAAADTFWRKEGLDVGMS